MFLLLVLGNKTLISPKTKIQPMTHLTSTMSNRTHTHLTDYELAEELAAAELLLESNLAEGEREAACLNRNLLIEELLNRYTNPV